MLENWQFSLGVFRSFPFYRRHCLFTRLGFLNRCQLLGGQVLISLNPCSLLWHSICVRKTQGIPMLKVDKIKLIELCGASETEFSSVLTSMKDLCFDVCGTEKEKKDPKDVKGNGELLDVLPEKRKLEGGGYSSGEGTEFFASGPDKVA